MIQYSIHLPRLCDRVTLAEIGRLHPVSLSVTENDAPLSTAQMELPLDDHAVQVGQFVELYDAAHSLGFYRISEVHVTYRAGRMQTVYLEHALSTLANDVIFGSIEYKKGDRKARQVIDELLNRQTVKYWQLWTDNPAFAADLTYLGQQSEDFLFEDQDLLQALLDCAACLEKELTWAVDMSRFPWRLIPRALPTEVTSEARLSRNVESLKLGYDWSALCTRIYPKGSGGGEDSITIRDATGSGGKLYIDSDTQGTWGVISQIWTDDTATSADTLFNKAKKQLEKVKNPIVSITLDGHDLSGLTGEPLDSFECGQPCRIAIPENGVSLALRILTIQHPDLVKDPARVSMTIGTADRRRVSRQRAQEAKGGGGSGPGQRTRKDTETYKFNGIKYAESTSMTLGYFNLSSEWVDIKTVSVSIALSDIDGDPSFDLYMDDKYIKTMSGGSVSLLQYLPYSGGKVARPGSHSLYLRYADSESEYRVQTIVTISGTKPASAGSSNDT